MDGITLEITGLLGFILSLILLILRIYEKRLKFDVEVICFMESKDVSAKTSNLDIQLSIVNKTEASFAITKIDILDCRGNWIDCQTRQIYLGSFNIKNNISNTVLYTMSTEPLPVNIAPMEGKRCFFRFELNNNALLRTPKEGEYIKLKIFTNKGLKEFKLACSYSKHFIR